GTAFELP
ncbi:hypothetical protein VCHENC02_3540B, partial [Vibrio harveyi]